MPGKATPIFHARKIRVPLYNNRVVLILSDSANAVNGYINECSGNESPLGLFCDAGLFASVTHGSYLQDDLITLSITESQYPLYLKSIKKGRATVYFNFALRCLYIGDNKLARIFIREAIILKIFSLKYYIGFFISFCNKKSFYYIMKLFKKVPHGN